MKRIVYLFVSFLPMCVNYIIIRMSIIISFIVNAYIDKYITDGDFSLSRKDLSKIISESFKKTNITGLIVGSLISILIFITWFMKIRKNAETKIRLKFSVLIAALVYGAACQAFLHLVLDKSYAGQSIGITVLLIFTGVINEQILLRAITMHYSCMASSSFLVANIIQAFIIACLQPNLLQGVCAFVLGFFMGIIFDKAGEGGLQHYSMYT